MSDRTELTYLLSMLNISVGVRIQFNVQILSLIRKVFPQKYHYSHPSMISNSTSHHPVRMKTQEGTNVVLKYILDFNSKSTNQPVEICLTISKSC